MAGIAYISRWTISSKDLRDEFCRDWWSAEAEGSPLEASLYHIEPDGFVSITRWLDGSGFERSRWGSGRPHSVKWGKYCVSGPEEMTSIIEIKQ